MGKALTANAERGLCLVALRPHFIRVQGVWEVANGTWVLAEVLGGVLGSWSLRCRQPPTAVGAAAAAATGPRPQKKTREAIQRPGRSTPPPGGGAQVQAGAGGREAGGAGLRDDVEVSASRHCVREGKICHVERKEAQQNIVGQSPSACIRNSSVC